MKAEIKVLTQKWDDLKNENTIIVRKNQVLQHQIRQMKDYEEQMLKNQQTLDSLKPIYLALRDKFPNEDMKSIMNKYDRLEGYCINYVKRIEELEALVGNIKDEKNQIAKEIQRKDYLLKQEENERHSLVRVYRKELDGKELAIEDQVHLKNEYKKIFNKILDLYKKWSSKLTVYDGNNELNLKSELSEPVEILDMMERIIKISATKDLQDYLKKIMISANILMRKFIPGSVNDKFDPDKIYDKLNKFIDILFSEVRKVNPKIEKKLLATFETMNQ